MTNILYKQLSLNMYRFTKGNSNEKVPPSVDLSIHTKLMHTKEQFQCKGSKIPFKPITILSRTLVIDLEDDTEDIFSSFHRQNKQKIKRAEREGFNHEVLLYPNSIEVQSYIDFFQTFAAWKGIPLLPENRFRKSAEAGVLSITWMRDDNQMPLCGHAYLHDKNRVIMIHYASIRDGKDSLSRNLIGRANRLLHWKNIEYYREIGIKWNDFSGIFLDSNNKQGLNINEFKRSSGGQEVDEIKVFNSHSLKGKLALLYMRWKWRSNPDYKRALK